VEEFSALNLLEIESCVQLKSTRTAERSYFDDRKKASSKRSRYGTILEPLMVVRGIGKWMSLLEASPASPSRLLDSKRGQTTSGICGPIPFALLEKSDQVGHSWRTSQLCLLADTLEQFSETWPRAAMMRDGKCYRRPKLELPISAIGCGLWPTVTTQDAENCAGPSQWERNSDPLNVAVKRYPTPQEDDSSNVHPNDKRRTTLVSTVDDGKGQLNPDWVCWLMGWPIGWESLQPFEWGNWPSDDWWSVDPADIPSDLEQDITVPMPPKNKYTVELNITNWPTPRAIYGEHPGMKDASHLTGAVQIPSQGTIPRVATGIPNRVDRLKALGNGQVPLCVKVAWEILIKEVI